MGTKQRTNMSNLHHELFLKAKEVIPGGVHSPVRSFKNLHTTPIFFSHANGAYLHDVTGKKYIDFCMSFGPLILGHRHPKVHQVITTACDSGISFGAAETHSLKLATLLVSKIPFIEQVRFVNSGTEAVMTAIRLARAHTSKDKIIKFSGCYHGHTDSMLIKAGSGLAEMSAASSAGIPKGVVEDTIVLELNDKDAVENAFIKYKNQIAAVIIEPLPANNGLLIQTKEFLQFLRDITKQNSTILIFDEVISGLRISFGGMAEKLRIFPDLVTYGKIIGGGMPVGAVAGPRKIMELLAPIGPVYQAGTLSANPLAMQAGLATLNELNEKLYITLEKTTQEICSIFNSWFQKNSNKDFQSLKAISYQSLFWIVENKDNTTYRSLLDIPTNLSATFFNLFKEFLDRGIYLAPNAYEVGFVSLAHDQEVILDLKRRLN